MGCIYIIKNHINSKVYVGKTTTTIEQRFKEHIRDSRKRRQEKRPLYNAMRKHGVDQFYIELIEQTENTADREKYWIQYYDSYHNGYNATVGGDGSEYVDKTKIISLYQECLNIKEVRRQTGHDEGTISKILKEFNIPVHWSKETIRKEKSKHIAKLDVNTNDVINVYFSIKEAAVTMGVAKQSISKALRSKSHKALGFIWKEISLKEYDEFTWYNNITK